MTNKIRIGPAGWSYKDWEGIVYPQKPGAKFDPLEYLARFFDTIEINSSFYRPFTATTAKSWASPLAAFMCEKAVKFCREHEIASFGNTTGPLSGSTRFTLPGSPPPVMCAMPWIFPSIGRSSGRYERWMRSSTSADAGASSPGNGRRRRAASARRRCAARASSRSCAARCWRGRR